MKEEKPMYYEDKQMCGCPSKDDEQPDCGGEVCKRVITQKADVSVPISISPTASVGQIQTECLGEPQIKKSQCKDTCVITVTQTISVKIPISYKVETKLGEKEVTCNI
jgi:hypothetical protein